MFAAAVTSGAIVASAPGTLTCLSVLVHVLFPLKSSPSVFSYLGDVTHRACVCHTGYYLFIGVFSRGAHGWWEGCSLPHLWPDDQADNYNGRVYRLNVYVPHPKFIREILTANLIVFEGGAFGS